MYLLRRTCAECSLAFECTMKLGEPWPELCPACCRIEWKRIVAAEARKHFPNGVVNHRADHASGSTPC